MTRPSHAVPQNPESAPAERLSLRDVASRLNERGVEIGYSTLSEFVKTGDIADQLGVGGSGQRREFHADVVDILAAFFPEYRENGGKTPQAPAMLRSFLRTQNALIRTGTSEMVPTATGTPPPPADPVAVAEAQGRALGLAQNEKALTAKEAADLLSISVSTLRKSVPPYRRFGKSPQGDRWLMSDLLRK